MPDHISDKITQWRDQVGAMKAAIAALGLQDNARKTTSVLANGDGEDDQDNLSSPMSSGMDGHDVWDFISDEELDEIDFDDNDYLDGAPNGDGLPDTPYGLRWLTKKCDEVASRKSGLSSNHLQDQISTFLDSSRSEDELQSSLTDLIGFDDLDFVIDLISHRKEVSGAAAASKSADATFVGPGGTRLLNKSQREDVLRQQDFRHKNGALAAGVSKEPQYPHVYRAFSAGNSLNHAGKRYALPVGSQRLEFPKYEEYFIPAGKPGGLWPGQTLVKISDLDGLCRRTFKGYQTLNRMQSLVYPIAYKTNENMLVCAPTGAVSAPLLERLDLIC